MRSVFVLPTVAVSVCLILACGDDGRPPGTASNDSALVGGPCMSNSECVDPDGRSPGLCEPSLPLGELNFPGGMCSVSCGDSSNCPSNSFCAELESGWVCVTACTETTDCRAQYACQSVVEAGTSGESTVSVCLGREALEE